MADERLVELEVCLARRIPRTQACASAWTTGVCRQRADHDGGSLLVLTSTPARRSRMLAAPAGDGWPSSTRSAAVFDSPEPLDQREREAVPDSSA